jgi:hypothetical protein
VGLSNTRERLRRLYGTRHSFEIVNLDRGGVRATIRLPWHIAEASTNGEPVR